jgi:methionine aminotransferase
MPIFPGQIKSKLPNLGNSIFSEMTQLSIKHQALNLAQGFPDFGPDKELIKLSKKYFRTENQQYAPMPGIIQLRETISKLVESWYSSKYDPYTEITIVPGATVGIYAAMSALLKENDEVIIFEPNYDCYVPALRMQGAKPVYVSLQHPEYRIDWNQVKKLINFRTKAIVINSPHNPTSTILSSEDLRKLSELVKNTDIWILSDEVYEHIIFDKYEHQSVARFPQLAERSIIASSFGKTLHATGWKMGYLLGPENLMEQVRKTYQYMVFSANTPLQYAINDYMTQFSNKIHLGDFYAQKRDYFLHEIKNSRFKVSDCKGTYFALLDYHKISKEIDVDYSKRLVAEHGIASIPTSVFYKNKIQNHALRFCFAKEEKTLKKAAQILCKIE